jgi:hypothetical protein
MTDLPQEECLKPDQLRSMTECERAIHAIAEKTGKSPLDIWRANETWLSELASTVDFKPDRNRLGIILLLVMEIMLPCCIYASYRATGWYGFTAGILVFWVLMNIEIVCLMFKQKLLVPFGKKLRSLLGVVFSIISTMFGFLSTPDSVVNRSTLALISVLLAMVMISILNFLPELLWNLSVKDRDGYREQLSTLRLVRPLLAGRSRSAVESRSSVVSCARLRKVVDWD